MHMDRLSRVTDTLKNTYDLDVLCDVLLGRADRIYLYAEKTAMEAIAMHVISGTLELIGFDDADEIRLSSILQCFDDDNRYADVAGATEYRQYVFQELARIEGEVNVTFPISKNHKRHWVHVLMSPITRNPKLLSIQITEITETMVKEEQNYDRSHRDALTGLFNKYTLDYHYGLRYRLPGFHAVFLDIDNFKSINDQTGHLAGDAVLRRFADVLQSKQSGYSRFYRLGGDEFVGLIFGDESHLRAMAEAILEETRSIRIPGSKQCCSVSIGIVASGQGDDVIRKADALMYEAKRSGKNCYLYWTEAEFDAKRTTS